MFIRQTTETFGNEDHSWLGSARGTQSTRSVTLKTSAFTVTGGYIPSGTPLGIYTSGANTGLVGPYTAGATDGTQTLAGFLFTSQKTPTDTSINVVAPLLDTGRVIVAKLPVSVDATAQATNPRFVYA